MLLAAGECIRCCPPPSDWVQEHQSWPHHRLVKEMACGDHQLSYARSGDDLILDDMTCLLDISIIGRLMGEEDVRYETCMMQL